MDQANWAKARFDEIKEGMTPFLRNTGFRDEDVIFVPITGLSGENIMEKK